MRTYSRSITERDEPELHTPVVWEAWKRKFAFFPVSSKNGMIWFQFYYRRHGRSQHFEYYQIGTLFDVLG